MQVCRKTNLDLEKHIFFQAKFMGLTYLFWDRDGIKIIFPTFDLLQHTIQQVDVVGEEEVSLKWALNALKSRDTCKKLLVRTIVGVTSQQVGREPTCFGMPSALLEIISPFSKIEKLAGEMTRRQHFRLKQSCCPFSSSNTFPEGLHASLEGLGGHLGRISTHSAS